MNNEQALTLEAEVKGYLKKISNEEQVYSIALFDILGFSNYVENYGSILKISGNAYKVNDSTAQCGTYYTTITLFFERALNDKIKQIVIINKS